MAAEITNGAIAAFRFASSVQSLDDAHREYLSANGRLKAAMRVGAIRPEDRHEAEREFDKAVMRLTGST